MDSKVLGLKWQREEETFSVIFLTKYNANLLITGNLNVTDAALLEIDDPFTNELIEIWLCLNFKKQPSDFWGLMLMHTDPKSEADLDRQWVCVGFVTLRTRGHMIVSHTCRTRHKRAKLRDFCCVMSHKDQELNKMIVLHTIASIYHKNMLTYLSADIICS